MKTISAQEAKNAVGPMIDQQGHALDTVRRSPGDHAAHAYQSGLGGRRATRRHLAASGHGNPADRPGGTVTGGWLERRFALDHTRQRRQRLPKAGFRPSVFDTTALSANSC